MEGFEIEIQAREEFGSAASRRYRAEGLIPLVVYSHGEASVHGVVSTQTFSQLAKRARGSQVFTLKSSVSSINGRPAVIKEIQKDFLSGLLHHVDLQALREDEEITVRVSVRIVGESPGVKLDGGILTVVSHEVGVRCLPRQIPDLLEADVSELRIGNSIHARDIRLPEGVKLADDPDETVVSVLAVRQTDEAPAAAAPAEGAAEAAAAPAAGASEEAKKGS